MTELIEAVYIVDCHGPDPLLELFNCRVGAEEACAAYNNAHPDEERATVAAIRNKSDLEVLIKRTEDAITRLEKARAKVRKELEMRFPFDGGEFDYERFVEGVGEFWGYPPDDASFVIGMGYELVRCFPKMAALFLDATKDGEPTEERLEEIYLESFRSKYAAPESKP